MDGCTVSGSFSVQRPLQRPAVQYSTVQCSTAFHQDAGAAVCYQLRARSLRMHSIRTAAGKQAMATATAIATADYDYRPMHFRGSAPRRRACHCSGSRQRSTPHPTSAACVSTPARLSRIDGACRRPRHALLP